MTIWTEYIKNQIIYIKLKLVNIIDVTKIFNLYYFTQYFQNYYRADNQVRTE